MKNSVLLNRNVIKLLLFKILLKIKSLWIKNNKTTILVYRNIYKVKY